MLYFELNRMILDAMRSKDNDRVNILRLIKNELVRKEKDGVTINDSVEATVLNKMVSQREDSIEQFAKANRMDLVEKETIEELIKAAQLAPSWKNTQVSRYYVAMGDAKKDFTLYARMLEKPYEEYKIDELATNYCLAVDADDEYG